MNKVRVCSLCGRIYVYDEFENNGYEDVCNHCKPIRESERNENGSN